MSPSQATLIKAFVSFPSEFASIHLYLGWRESLWKLNVLPMNVIL